LGAKQAEYICLDINARATEITTQTGKANGAALSAVRCSMLQCVEQRAVGQIDVLLFNPPYVPTTTEEEEQAQRLDAAYDDGQISAAWAGGSTGTRLLDMLVHGKGLCRYPLSDLLAPGGAFYLVAIKQNKPESIVNTLQEKGLQAEVGVVSTVACFAGITLTMFAHDQIVLSRRAGGEHLYIIRAIKPAHAPSSG
jgi:release factor glutamine methyltransferase